jgi:hypothetical protein
MPVYRMNDGKRVKALNPHELVGWLRRNSDAGPSTSRREWMQETAVRAEQSKGTAVRTDTTEHFVADLIQAGIISEEEKG